jgi:hypothetical protein
MILIFNKSPITSLFLFNYLIKKTIRINRLTSYKKNDHEDLYKNNISQKKKNHET